MMVKINNLFMDLLGGRMTLPAEFRGSCVQCEWFLLVCYCPGGWRPAELQDGEINHLKIGSVTSLMHSKPPRSTVECDATLLQSHSSVMTVPRGTFYSPQDYKNVAVAPSFLWGSDLLNAPYGLYTYTREECLRVCRPDMACVWCMITYLLR